MMPKIAVVCGADTELGKFVVRELIRSPQILHIYALAEQDVIDDIPHAPHHIRKLTLLVQPFDFVERTIGDSVPEADLAFCCLGSPRYVYSSLGPYLYHKLNLDIPLRFLYEMTRLAAHSVSFLTHPSASSRSRSQFLRVKGELLDAVRTVQNDVSPHAPRVTFLMIPYVLTDTGLDPARAPTAKISTLDRIKQRAVMKHDVSPKSAVHVRDAAKAMVADAITHLVNDTGANLHPLTAELALPSHRFVQMDAAAIVELANATRTQQRDRQARRRDRTAMQEKASEFARAATPGGFDSVSGRRSVPRSDTPSSPIRPPDVQAAGIYDSRDDTPPQDATFSPESSVTSPPRRPARHSVDAMARQLSRPLTRMRSNAYLPDTEEPGDDNWEAEARAALSRSRSYHEPTATRASVPSTRGPPTAASGTSGASARGTRSFHAAGRSQPLNGSGSERRASSGLVAQLSALAARVISATDRPSARRQADARARRKARAEGGTRGSADLRAVGETTI